MTRTHLHGRRRHLAAVPDGGWPAMVLDRDYWLAHCGGFAVVGRDGRIGTVTGVRYRDRKRRPRLLEVESGFLGHRPVLVDVDRIGSIEPNRRRLTVIGEDEYDPCDPPAGGPPGRDAA
jgi:hypothetical protein